MPDYQKLYLTLFRGICDSLEELDRQNYGAAKAVLIKAQQDAEALYMTDKDE